MAKSQGAGGGKKCKNIKERHERKVVLDVALKKSELRGSSYDKVETRKAVKLSVNRKGEIF